MTVTAHGRPTGASLPWNDLLPPSQLDGVDEATWLDVIQQDGRGLLAAGARRDRAGGEERPAGTVAAVHLQPAVGDVDVLVACNEARRDRGDQRRAVRTGGPQRRALRGTPLQTCWPTSQRERMRAMLRPHQTRAQGERSSSTCATRNASRCRWTPTARRATRATAARGPRVRGPAHGEIKRAYHQLREAHEALKRTQQQLLHSEKMASLGRLVAGVAHELNNPISFVLGNVHALQRYSDRLRQYLDAVHAQAAGRPTCRRCASQLRIDHLLADLPSLMEGTLEGAQRTADIVQRPQALLGVDREERARWT
jgi:two-component system sensor histidine kinase HupT/HoxJ